MRPGAPVWEPELPPPYPSLTSDLSADIAVIGAGLTGLSAAYHLLVRRPGANVVVVEAERVGAGASGRTTGMVGPGVGQSLVALVRRLGRERASALYRATLRAVEDVRRLVLHEQIDCDLRIVGQVIIARSPGTRARLAKQADLLESLSLPGERLDEGALYRIVRLAPLATSANPGAGPAALRLPMAGTLNPARLLSGLADRVVCRGGRIFERARVTAIGEGRPVRIATAGGPTITAGEVVVATAGYTPELGLFRGRILPVHLQALVTEPLTPAAFDAIGWSGREGLLDARRIFNYCRLTADDRIVFGGGSPRYQWSGSTRERGGGAAALRALIRELQSTFPAAAGLRVDRGWTGVIAYTLDALPAIQRLRKNPSVVHAVGWCGHGIALAVASGAWITHILCEGAAPEDLPWYRDRVPKVPLEPARWLSFRAAISFMSLMDRFT